MNIINMQQLKIEHNKIITTDQKVVENTTTIKKDRRAGKGRAVALSRRIYRLQNSDVYYYVESESCDSIYYFLKFKPSSVLESSGYLYL